MLGVGWDLRAKGCAVVRGLDRTTVGTFVGMLPSFAVKILFLLNAEAPPWPSEAWA